MQGGLRRTRPNYGSDGAGTCPSGPRVSVSLLFNLFNLLLFMLFESIIIKLFNKHHHLKNTTIINYKTMV